ncbi:MAG: VWA domain-containing protein [Acidimicrobiia bacterium]
MASAFAGNLVHFTRYLRSQGLSVVPETSALLLRATHVIGLTNRDDAYYAMRAVTVTHPADLPIFDAAFELFFGGGLAVPVPAPGSLEVDRGGAHRIAKPAASTAQSDEVEVTEQVGASSVERLSHRDFNELTPEELEEVRRLMAQMMWQPADARSRRWAPTGRGPRPDLRRTLRGIVGPSGDLLPLEWSERRMRRRPLLVLADVSGSMERYVEMFLYFTHAARDRLGKLEAFVFSTRLTRITRQLAKRDPKAALDDVGNTVEDWSGGTKIGEALEEFNLRWARRVTRGGPIALIISDGWDCGEPALLAREMARFRRTVHRVIWLNPLAGQPGYEPLVRGMQTVLPFVDDFLRATNLTDLRELVKLVESVSARV